MAELCGLNKILSYINYTSEAIGLKIIINLNIFVANALKITKMIAILFIIFVQNVENIH